MTDEFDLGPYKHVTAAATALLAMGGVVMTQWIPFLKPPPPLYYGEKEMFWLALATVCSGLVCALVFILLPAEKEKSTKTVTVLAVLTVVVLLVLVVISIAYNQQRSSWTFTSLQGESVLIGEQYTDAALADSKTPGINIKTLFMDFGEQSRDIWMKSGLQRRQRRLGIIYLFASVTGGVCLSLAAWVVITFTSKTLQTQAGSRAPQRNSEHSPRRSRSGRKKKS